MNLLSDSFALALESTLDQRAEQNIINVRAFADDPVQCARQVFGIVPWKRQEEILRAPLQSKNISIRSGHKVSKSTSLALLAWWFYLSFPAARVVGTAVTDRQVNQIWWREVRRLAARAKKDLHWCPSCDWYYEDSALTDGGKHKPSWRECHTQTVHRPGVIIPGASDIHKVARSGVVDPSDFSEIMGYTAREAEAIAGTSGEYLMYLLDEASGIPTDIFQAIQGNRMAGAWLIMTSNPTKSTGEYYESFHSKKHVYLNIHIDSREMPNSTGESHPIPGGAGPEAIARFQEEYGEDSAEFAIRVKGDFSAAEESKAIHISLLLDAQEANKEYQQKLLEEGGSEPSTRPPLYIGIDPAGDGEAGDETQISWRRGNLHLGLTGSSRWRTEHVTAQLEDILRKEGATDPMGRILSGEPAPVIVIDSEGPIGYDMFKSLKLWAEKFETAYGRTLHVTKFRASQRAWKEPFLYVDQRAELWANGRKYLQNGGGILEDDKLLKELHFPDFLANNRNLLFLTPKKEFRKELKRSPDRADAWLLSLWERKYIENRRDQEKRKVLAPPKLQQETNPFKALSELHRRNR